MARVRSPNYPQLSLLEAINRVKIIHAAEQHLAAPKAVVAKHLGYGGLNGTSNKVISAIGKYGLLEEVNGDKIKVSSTALAILYPAKPEEKAEAIKQAALNPPLFAEIHTEWGGAQPSDENLRAYLVRRNFATDALDRVIQSYRETMDLVTQESGAYDSRKSHHGAEVRVPAATVHTRANPPTIQAGMPMSVAFDGERLEVSAVLTDSEAVDKLIKALNATKALLPAKVTRQEDEAAN